MNGSRFFVRIPNRGRVSITGPDARPFLQGLITNDINLLDRQALIYACLLTPQGKFLHDFFVSEEGDMLHLECEGADRALDLATRLSKFKLRSKINIEHTDSIDVFCTNPTESSDRADPRHPALGQRLYTRPTDHGAEAPFTEWDRQRIRLTIPDGSRDLIVGQSTMEEGRLDHLNAVSYDKGCYMGQELTARMHYRGLGKKHLYTVQSTGDATPLPPPGTDLYDEQDKRIGTMRSSCGDMGLALLNDGAEKQQIFSKTPLLSLKSLSFCLEKGEKQGLSH